jgi:hypothetical protein
VDIYRRLAEVLWDARPGVRRTARRTLASAGSALDRDALLAMGHSEQQAHWLLAHSPRSGYLTREDYEALQPDLPGWLGRRWGVQP